MTIALIGNHESGASVRAKLNRALTLLNTEINIFDYLTAVEQADVIARTGLLDVTAAFTAMIAAIPATGACIRIPAGRYVTSGGFTISKPFSMIGDGAGGQDGNGAISQIECNDSSTLFTITADSGLFEHLGLVCTSPSPVDGSSAVLTNSATNFLQRINYWDIYVDGFYVSIDVKTGASWLLGASTIINSKHIGVRMRNTLNVDAGGGQVINNIINPTTNAAAGIKAESGGGFVIRGNSILCNAGGTIVDGIVIDFTGAVTQQLQVFGNQIDFVSGYPMNIVHGLKYAQISNNFLNASRGLGPAIKASFLSEFYIGPNVCIGNGGAAIELDNSNAGVILPQDIGLDGYASGVSFGASSGIAYGDIDLSQIRTPANLNIGPVDPRLPGLTLETVTGSNDAEGSYFSPAQIITIDTVEIVVGVQSGNIDVGIYDQTAHQWITSAGSFPCPPPGVWTGIALTTAVTLYPDHVYFAAIAADNTTATFLMAKCAYSVGPVYVPLTFDVGAFPIPSPGSPSGHNSPGVKSPVANFSFVGNAAQFFARVSAQDTLHATAYLTFINTLVAAGVWNKLDIINLYAAADSAAALTNLKSSLYATTNPNSLTFTADSGFSGGSGGLSVPYPNSQIVQYVQNSGSYFAWTTNSANSGASNGFVRMGTLAVTSMFPRYTDGHMYLDLNSTADDPSGIAVSAAAGLYGGSRTGTVLSYYQNGVKVGTRTDTAHAVEAGGKFSPQQTGYPGTCMAFCAGAALSDADATALYNAMHAYLQSVAGVA